MNAYELADKLETDAWDEATIVQSIHLGIKMLRQQADRIAELETVLRSIANEPIELSHDKIKWQCQDHIRWAKDILK
jgi:hypothetical protein